MALSSVAQRNKEYLSSFCKVLYSESGGGQLNHSAAVFLCLLRMTFGVIDGLVLCIVFVDQQSSAFKILQTRLKTVPSYTFMHVQPPSSTEFPGLSAIRRTASSGGYGQILSHIPAIPAGLSTSSEDGDKITDASGGASGINFAAQLKQFEHMQYQHHLHRTAQRNLPRKLPSTSLQV